MANTYYWIKLYYDLLDDHKVGNLPDSLKWRFIQCLLVAGETREDGFLPPVDVMAFRIRPITPEALNDDLSRLARPGLVELKQHPDGDERWFVSKFSERQQSISNAERQRAWRARKAEEKQENITPPLQDNNDTVTTRYLDKIRKDKDIDINKKKPKTTHTPEYLPEPVHEFANALALVCKTPYVNSHEAEYHEAAYYLHGLDATKEQISGFSDWWKDNGYYQGKPALSSLLDEWSNYKNGTGANQKQESAVYFVPIEDEI